MWVVGKFWVGELVVRKTWGRVSLAVDNLPRNTNGRNLSGSLLSLLRNWRRGPLWLKQGWYRNAGGQEMRWDAGHRN